MLRVGVDACCFLSGGVRMLCGGKTQRHTRDKHHTKHNSAKS